MYTRAVLCQCRRHLEAANDEALGTLVRKHLTSEHATMRPTDDQVAEIVSARAYDIEYAESDAGAESMDEEFGPGPY